MHAHATAAKLEKRNFSVPDEVKSTPHSKVEVIHLGGRTFTKYTFLPGFRWTSEVKPIARRDFCPFLHNVVQVSGRMMLRLRDGTQLEIRAGDAHIIPPEHDGWVLGDEPVVDYAFE